MSTRHRHIHTHTLSLSLSRLLATDLFNLCRRDFKEWWEDKLLRRNITRGKMRLDPDGVIPPQAMVRSGWTVLEFQSRALTHDTHTHTTHTHTHTHTTHTTHTHTRHTHTRKTPPEKAIEKRPQLLVVLLPCALLHTHTHTTHIHTHTQAPCSLALGDLVAAGPVGEHAADGSYQALQCQRSASPRVGCNPGRHLKLLHAHAPTSISVIIACCCCCCCCSCCTCHAKRLWSFVCHSKHKLQPRQRRRPQRHSARRCVVAFAAICGSCCVLGVGEPSRMRTHTATRTPVSHSAPRNPLFSPTFFCLPVFPRRCLVPRAA